MPSAGTAGVSRFAASFPQRFAEALADAQGAIAGIAASGEGDGRGLIDAEAMRRLHEIYDLRVELEIETAGVLWRTAEVVCAMADMLELLSRRRTAGADAEARRRQAGLLGPLAARPGWSGFGGAEGAPAPEPEAVVGWPPRRAAAAGAPRRAEALPGRRFGSQAA